MLRRVGVCLLFAVFFLTSVCRGEEVTGLIEQGGAGFARVITAHTPPPPTARGSRSGVFMRCNRPLESREFSECHAEESGDFPATTARCLCTNCNLVLRLTCQVDGNWYPADTNVCSSENRMTHCGLCAPDAYPPHLLCDWTERGYLREVRRCLCHHDCMDVELRCDTSGRWEYEHGEQCERRGTFTYMHDRTQNVTFSGGRYSFSCVPGYLLIGSSEAQCVQGRLTSGEFPECVPQEFTPSSPSITNLHTNDVTTQVPDITTNTPLAKDVRKVHGAYTMTVVAVVLVVLTFALATYVWLRYCKVNHVTLTSQEQIYVKPNQVYLKDGKIKDFMLNNDMYRSIYTMSQKV